MSDREKKCEERIDDKLKGRLKDIRKIWDDYTSGEYEDSFHEYGLSFDYVAPGTFADQEQGYFRWQLSYGGPSDEFRFYANPDLSCYCVEYVFMDWFDVATRKLEGEDRALLIEIYNWFDEVGVIQTELEKASE